MLYEYWLVNYSVVCSNSLSPHLDYVAKTYTTQPSTIISTVVVRFKYFLVELVLSEYAIMPLQGGLISHLACLVYLLYLGKL